MQQDDPSDFFWNIADDLLRDSSVTKGTIMGFPCLRINGDFFSSTDHRTGDLIVMLAEDRVNDIISQGSGEPFAPAGRVFREWVRITKRDSQNCDNLKPCSAAYPESKAQTISAIRMYSVSSSWYSWINTISTSAQLSGPVHILLNPMERFIRLKPGTCSTGARLKENEKL